MADTTPLQDELTNLRSVRSAVEVYVESVASRVEAAAAEAVAANDAADMTAITAVAAEIRGEANAISTAITANTPAEEPAP